MELKPYRPSGSVPISGQLILTFVAIVGGAILGGLLFLISKVIYLVLLFPIGMGVIAALAMESGVRAGRVRSPLAAGFYGLLLGLAIYASYHYYDYLDFRAQARSSVAITAQEEGVSMDRHQVDLVVDGYLSHETGRAGFPGFLLLKAAEGVSIGDLFGSDQQNLGPFLSWVYWVAELAIIAGCAAYYGWQTATHPYCESCDGWYGAGVHLGSVEGSAKQELLRLVKGGELRQAGRLLADHAQLPSVRVYLESCEACESSDSRLVLKEASIGRNRQRKSEIVLQGMVTPQQRAALLQGAADEITGSGAEGGDAQASPGGVNQRD